MGLDVSVQRDNLVGKPSTMKEVVRMLQTTRDYKIAIPQTVLYHLLTNYANLTPPKYVESDVEPSWNLIATIVSIRPNLFVDGVTSDKSRSSIYDSLFSTIERNICVDSQYAMAQGMPEYPYDMVKQDILIPLLKAFASARSLVHFLTLWYEKLCQFYIGELKNKGEPFKVISVWEDDDLVVALGSVTEVSLTNGQIQQLLHRFGSVLQEGLPQDNEQHASFLASATIQRFILSSLHCDDTMKELLPAIQETHINCVTILKNANNPKEKDWPVLWKLLAVCETLRMPLLETAAFESQPFLVGWSMHHCVIQGLRTGFHINLEAGIHALGYLGVLLSTINLRHGALKPFPAQPSQIFETLADFFHNLKGQGDENKATTFALALSTFPILLRYVDSSLISLLSTD